MSSTSHSSLTLRFYFFTIALILTTYWASYQSILFYDDHIEAQSKSIEIAVTETKKLVTDIEHVLNALPLSAESIAEAVLKQPFTSENLEKTLKNTLIEHVSTYGIGIAFKPYQFNAEWRLYAPYFMRNKHTIQRVDIADSYDYTEKAYRWFGDAIETEARWSDLFFDEVRNAWIVEYTLPLIKDNKTIGLIFISYTLNSLQKRINLIDLGEQGYSFVVNSQGRFIDYPILEHVYSTSEKENLIENLPGFNTPSLKHVLLEIKNRRSGKAEYKSDITHKQSWLHYQSIANTDWTVITVFKKKKLVEGGNLILQNLIKLTLLWSVSLLFLTGMIASYFRELSVTRYWVTSCFISVILSTDIAGLWFISLQEKVHESSLITPISSYSNLEDFKKGNTIKSLLTRNDPPLYVPTGVFVQSIEFSSANNVIMTGYIWQRYFHEYHKGLSQGIVMPEAESFELVESFEREDDESILKGWYFKVTLRQNFDYGHYPLDSQSVWIRLWHKDFDKNVVLTPYLDSYKKLNPDWLPGIEEDFVLSGWKLDRSYFNYHHNNYNTNFGIDNYVGQSLFPELYYNIVLKRDFFDSFVSQLAPLVVVLLMLFAILVTSSKDKNKNSFLGFNTSGVLASSSALFFVVMVSHIDLRSSLSAKEIIYLEVFYFVTYITILVVSVNSILFSWGIRFPVINGKSWIQFKDNLIPKLLYWPMVTGQLLILTIIALYPKDV